MKSKRASEGDGRTFVLALSERHEAVVRAYELTFVKAAEDDFDRVIASTPCTACAVEALRHTLCEIVCADEFAQTAL